MQVFESQSCKDAIQVLDINSYVLFHTKLCQDTT